LKCPRCQQDNPARAKFCLECGAPCQGAHEGGPSAEPYADLRSALTEALEQQAGTSEILRVISSSPTDVQPIFDAIAESAVRLCDGLYGSVVRYDGETLHLVATNHTTTEALELRRHTYPRRLGTQDSLVDRAIAESRIVHIADIETDPMVSAWSRAQGRALGYRSFLAAPMLREGRALGVVIVSRTEPAPFSDRQMSLLQTFAAQAVIAIENVRLFQELQARNAELTESLEQQTATAEILKVISTSPTDLQPVLDAVVGSAARFCGAHDAEIYHLDGGSLKVAAHHGPISAPMGRLVPVVRGSLAGRAVLERRPVHVADLPAEAKEFPVGSALARELGYRTALAVPLLREGTAVGTINLRRNEVKPFTEREIALLETFADQAVIAIENVRLFRELEARNRALTETLEQQTATSEILRVISGSTTDAQPVFDSIVGSARRLCEATFSAVVLFEAGQLTVGSVQGVDLAGIDALLRTFPRPAARDNAVGRAVLDQSLVHIEDASEDTDYTYSGRDALEIRSILAVPMLRENVPIGAISVWRAEVRPFTDTQIALLRTFADQAVIAIENARLFQELEARNAELTETLEQQTATAEILRVISSSPTDLGPVMEAVAENAGRVCGATYASIFRLEGEHLRLVARNGSPRIGYLAIGDTIPVSRDTIAGRVVRDRRTIHVEDLTAAEQEFPITLSRTRQAGAHTRTILATPLLRESTPLGVIFINRGPEVHPFSAKQIALLETFANQAVIAIENVRLFQELEARNHELTETLEQQTATGEILRVISRSPTDVQPVFDAVAANAARLCGVDDVTIHRVEDGGLRRIAHVGGVPVLADSRLPLLPGGVNERVLSERRTMHIADTHAPSFASQFPGSQHAAMGIRSLLATPLVRDGVAIGLIQLRRSEPRPFTDKQIALLETFADQAVIAIENVRLFKELEARNRDLTEALEQQTATAEILRVISTSPTDVQPVLDTVAENAARVCGADDAIIARLDGDALRTVAGVGQLQRLPPEEGWPVHGSVSGRAVIERRTVHTHDMQTVSDAEFPYSMARMRVLGLRTVLATPLLREGVPIGLIVIRRVEVRPFSDKQIALLETFANQAVIAIENVRLFQELEARNAELTESLEQQTATSEILRVISSSPTEVQPVFDTIVASAVRLCGARMGAAYRFDGQSMHLVAHHNYPPEVLEILQRMHPRPPQPDQASGRAILTRAVAQIEDMFVDQEYRQEVARAGGWRSIVAVPMLRDGEPTGAIVITRNEAGPFAAGYIDLLKTFADQAVIAIENVRLFQELEARNTELTETLEQQTATAEILRVIASSPTDLQPVMEAVAESAARVCGATDSSIYRLEGERLRLVARHGTLRRAVMIGDTIPVNRDAVSGQAVRARRTIQVEDIMAVEAEFPDSVSRLRQVGSDIRTVVATPLLREGTPLGIILILRGPEVHPFSAKQIALLETFANQSVIAIENVRLFNELRERTVELTRSVEQLTALGEVSRAVSSTLDVEAVLDAIVSRASQLAGADGCSIYEYDEGSEQFHLRATHNLDTAFVEAIRAVPLRKGEGLMGRATEMREPVQVPDITQTEAYQSGVREAVIQFGYRALLSVPLVREDQIIGSLSLTRKASGEFPPEVIDVLKTFATQSALAIQNARLFREIADKSQQLEAASRHKSEFLANMSHELRTPLNAILGFNEMILGEVYGPLSADLKEPLTDIQNSGKHLLRLINNVLDLSKIEAGRMELVLMDYVVPDLVERVRASLHPLAAEKGLEFVAAVPTDIPLARGDAGRITQCLMNLAGNALKFTREGRVEISVGLQGDGLVYRVADTGIGIAKDKLETVFAEFRQGDATITSEFGGTGLGLSITKKFVEMHGGRIWVESEPGKGSTFSFVIPLRLAGGQTT
jgi:GAF domain-containing protein